MCSTFKEFAQCINLLSYVYAYITCAYALISSDAICVVIAEMRFSLRARALLCTGDQLIELFNRFRVVFF